MTFAEMRFPEAMIRDYPYPVAVSVRRVNDATESVEKFLCLASLFEVTLKYLTAISLAQYLRDQAVDQRIQEELGKLPRPTLGVWKEILRSCLDFYSKHRDQAFAAPELRDGFAARLPSSSAGTEPIWSWIGFLDDYLGNEEKRSKLSLQILLDQLVRYRNRTWGHGVAQLTPEFCTEHGERFLPGFQAVLDQLSYLGRYPLRYVKEVRKVRGQDTHIMFDYMGTAGRQGAPYTGDYVQERRLYLCSAEGQPRLCLHPLFVVHERRVFALEYHEQDAGEGDGKVGYSDCETGKPFAPNRLSSYQISLVADDRHKKLGQAELPVPPEQDGLEVDESAPATPLANLMQRLDAEASEALTLGLGEALRIGHFWLGIEFFLMGLSRQPGTLFAELLQQAALDASEFRGMLRGLVNIRNKRWREVAGDELGHKAFPSLKEADRAVLQSQANYDDCPPVVTPRIMSVLRRAEELAGGGSIGTAHLLLAAMDHPYSLAVNVLLGRLDEGGLKPIVVRDRLLDCVHRPAALPAPGQGAPQIQLPKRPPQQQAPPTPASGLLGRFGRDLTADARAGKLTPAVGVDRTLRRIKRILIQRQSNNPLLIGEPGVGKTALVHGLAIDLAQGSAGVPELAGRRLIELSLNALVAGTRYRGELEERVTQLLAEVKASRDVILFIDEIHTLLGGGSDSGMGLADALKPALAAGEFPCIGATTIAEYRQRIEKDPALARRFETVLVEEPTPEVCLDIVRGLVPLLQQHFPVKITDGAVEAAVRLSARYLPDERLPSKAIKLLEQAAAYVRIPSVGLGVPPEEKGPKQVFFTEVNENLIRHLLAQKTGIPLEHLAGEELERLKSMAEILEAEVIGQDEAVRAVAQTVKRARAGIRDPNRPVGVFLFVGPTGVGKTELARALARFLFHDAGAMIRLDMSEYHEKHQVSRLIGAPPGYVRSDEEGQLTGKLRLRPFSVVLLDEIEKAHDDVHDLFLQLFDEGRLTDTRGRVVDGREAVFIMTSNVGADAYAHGGIGYLRPEELSPAWLQEKHAAVDSALRARFKPEFLNRIDRIVHFKPLTPADVTAIFQIQFKALSRRMQENRKIRLAITPDAAAHVASAGYDALNGARPLKRAIQELLEEPLTDLLLSSKIAPGEIVTISHDGTRLRFDRAMLPEVSHG